jgi:hypothetical protein
MFEGLVRTAGPGTDLARRGRGLTARVMLRSNDAATLVTLRDGAVVSVQDGPFVMPSYDFAIVCTREAWRAHFEAVPVPGSHDIMALVRRGAMHFEGNLHPLMANLLYFKLLLASLRPAPEAAA